MMAKMKMTLQKRWFFDDTTSPYSSNKELEMLGEMGSVQNDRFPNHVSSTSCGSLSTELFQHSIPEP